MTWLALQDDMGQQLVAERESAAARAARAGGRMSLALLELRQSTRKKAASCRTWAVLLRSCRHSGPALAVLLPACETEKPAGQERVVAFRAVTLKMSLKRVVAALGRSSAVALAVGGPALARPSRTSESP